MGISDVLWEIFEEFMFTLSLMNLQENNSVPSSIIVTKSQRSESSGVVRSTGSSPSFAIF